MLRCLCVVAWMVVSFSVDAVAESTAPKKVEAGIDRLVWIAKLEKRLRNGRMPTCIGPLGCKAEIPVGSPCRSPAKKQPTVIIDGIVPGSAPDTWVAAYRLTCSACYEGGHAYLLLLYAGPRGEMQFLDKIALKKRPEEIPKPLEMIQDDFDENEQMEVACHYGYVKERSAKCTGMADASSSLIIIRPEKRRLRVLFHEQLSRVVDEKQSEIKTAYRFEDASEDGYPDLITIRVQPRPKKGPTITTFTVRRYNDGEKNWSKEGNVGLLPWEEADMTCDMPLPDKPFAVVAAMHKEKRPTHELAHLIKTLRESGFEGTCLYDTKTLKGFKAARYVTIVSGHATRKGADAAKLALRRAGFSPFVKELFD